MKEIREPETLEEHVLDLLHAAQGWMKVTAIQDRLPDHLPRGDVLANCLNDLVESGRLHANPHRSGLLLRHAGIAERDAQVIAEKPPRKPTENNIVKKTVKKTAARAAHGVSQEKVFQVIATTTPAPGRDVIITATKLTGPTVSWHLQQLVKAGRIERVGPYRNAPWQVAGKVKTLAINPKQGESIGAATARVLRDTPWLDDSKYLKAPVPAFLKKPMAEPSNEITVAALDLGIETLQHVHDALPDNPTITTLITRRLHVIRAALLNAHL